MDEGIVAYIDMLGTSSLLTDGNLTVEERVELVRKKFEVSDNSLRELKNENDEDYIRGTAHVLHFLPMSDGIFIVSHSQHAKNLLYFLSRFLLKSFEYEINILNRPDDCEMENFVLFRGGLAFGNYQPLIVESIHSLNHSANLIGSAIVAAASFEKKVKGATICLHDNILQFLLQNQDGNYGYFYNEILHDAVHGQAGSYEFIWTLIAFETIINNYRTGEENNPIGGIEEKFRKFVKPLLLVYNKSEGGVREHYRKTAENFCIGAKKALNCVGCEGQSEGRIRAIIDNIFSQIPPSVLSFENDSLT